MNTVLSENVNGCSVKVYRDESPENPREAFDNLGTILYKDGSRYLLGDETAYQEEMETLSNNPDYISLPVYVYIHSGIAMNTNGFSCPWDSGQSGIIYVSKEEVRKVYGVKAITKSVREKVENVLRSEIKEFSAYLNGDVYGYVVENGDEKESCWGFYEIEDCLEEARSVANSIEVVKVVEV